MGTFLRLALLARFALLWLAETYRQRLALEHKDMGSSKLTGFKPKYSNKFGPFILHDLGCTCTKCLCYLGNYCCAHFLTHRKRASRKANHLPQPWLIRGRHLMCQTSIRDGCDPCSTRIFPNMFSIIRYHDIVEAPIRLPRCCSTKFHWTTSSKMNRIMFVGGQVSTHVRLPCSRCQDISGYIRYIRYHDSTSIINGNFRILNWRYLPYIRPI